MDAQAKGFRRLAQDGFKVETLTDSQVCGAQPGEGRPWRLDHSLPFFTGVRRSYLLSLQNAAGIAGSDTRERRMRECAGLRQCRRPHSHRSTEHSLKSHQKQKNYHTFLINTSAN